jgi:hypothetical protein
LILIFKKGFAKIPANVYNHICNKNQLKEFENLPFGKSVKNLCIIKKSNGLLQIFLNTRTNIFACLRKKHMQPALLKIK